ncbi:hypothetical protein BJ912DRAFT_1068651 [Pholiota molesta]|nr:hypothetical protein BJ912DRAFT_1068651 [Pholiota molesta]
MSTRYRWMMKGRQTHLCSTDPETKVLLVALGPLEFSLCLPLLPSFLAVSARRWSDYRSSSSMDWKPSIGIRATRTRLSIAVTTSREWRQAGLRRGWVVADDDSMKDGWAEQGAAVFQSASVPPLHFGFFLLVFS